MTSKKFLLLGLSLMAPATSLRANLVKDINDFLKEHVPYADDYGLTVAGTVITIGGIYLLYANSAYTNQQKLFEAHKEKLSPHERLQDHYDHLLAAQETYKAYTSAGHFTQKVQRICAQLEKKMKHSSELSELYTTASQDAARLAAEHAELLNLFAVIEHSPHHAPLALQKEHFTQLYESVSGTLTDLLPQITYVETKLFLKNHEELAMELTLKNYGNQTHFMHSLNDIIHSRSHGSSRYPYRSYANWLKSMRPQVAKLVNRTQNFNPLPFQQETMRNLQDLHTILDLIETRIKGSDTYKKESKAYDEECRRRAEEEARRKEALRKMMVEQAKLHELQKQTRMLKQKEQRKRQQQLNEHAVQPPVNPEIPATASAPSYYDVNPYAQPPQSSDIGGPAPSAPPLYDEVAK